MRFLWLSLAVILLDQVTKLWIDGSFTLHERVPVIAGFFDLMLAYNEGAAFSFLANQDGWQRWFFTGLTLVISIVLFIWLRRLPLSHRWTAFAIALVIGGAVGKAPRRVPGMRRVPARRLPAEPAARNGRLTGCRAPHAATAGARAATAV